MRALLRSVGALLLLAVGGVSAVAAAAVHGHWWGLVLAYVAVTVVLLAIGPGWTTRLPFAVGFVAVIARLAVPRPEGDFVLGADPAGYLVLLLTLAVVVASIGTLPRLRRSGSDRGVGTCP